jgi:hypothetical protein
MAESRLTPFNPDSTCPKCGHDTVNTQYQAPYHSACDDTCRDKKPERLERRCDRCRYWWGEAVLDPARIPTEGAGR